MNDRFLFPGDLIELFKSEYVWDSRVRNNVQRWLPAGMCMVVKDLGFTRVPEGSNISFAGDVVMTPMVIHVGSSQFGRVSIRRSDHGTEWVYVVRGTECNSNRR